MGITQGARLEYVQMEERGMEWTALRLSVWLPPALPGAWSPCFIGEQLAPDFLPHSLERLQ